MCHLPLGESKFVHSQKTKKLWGTGYLLVCLLCPIAWRVLAQVEISSCLPGETIGPHARFMFQPGLKIWFRLPVGDIIFQSVCLGGLKFPTQLAQTRLEFSGRDEFQPG